MYRLIGSTSARFACRAIAIAILATLPAACASSFGVKDVVQPRAVPPGQALVITPPGSAALLGVIETQYVNATEQYITLETKARTPGQNYIKVQSFTRSAKSFTPGGLQDVPLANLDLAGEARGTVNFADMKLSPYFVQNIYGPFGYSMGRTATADLCMYAWQRIEPHLRPSGAVERGAINLRMQVCDHNKSEQELLALMLQLRVDGVTGIPRAAPRQFGANGLVVSAFGGSFPGNVLPQPQRQPAAPARTTQPTVTNEPSLVNVPRIPSPTTPASPTVPSTPLPIVPAPASAILPYVYPATRSSQI